MRGRRTAWIAAALAAGAALTAVAGWRLAAGDGPVPTTTAETAPFIRRVTAEGNLRAVDRTPLTASMKSMRRPLKIAWMVADGSRVAAGDVVVRFDPTDFQDELEQGLSEREIADSRIGKASVRREGDLANLDRDVDQARRELDNAERFQAVDTDLYSRMEIVESEIDTGLARHRMGHASASITIQDRRSETDLELLQIQRRQADLKVQQAREELDSLVLRAPNDGIVVFERDWRGNRVRVGDTVWPGRPIATLPDLSRMEAEVYVLEADAGGLAPGQEGTVVLEAHPDRPVAATVRQVDPIAQQRIRGVPVQYFRAVLELAATDPGYMKPGARIRAEIVLESIDDAITVPRQAVATRDGADVVFRASHDGFEAVSVTLGPSSLGRVVVTSGLAPGDEIALVDPDRARQPGGDGGPPTPAVGGPA